MKAPSKYSNQRLLVQLELPLSDNKTLLTCGSNWREKGGYRRPTPANSNDPFSLDDNYFNQI